MMFSCWHPELSTEAQVTLILKTLCGFSVSEIAHALWSMRTIGRGFRFLEKSSMGKEMSEYHLEAGIAALHCAALTYEKTEWGKILELYDTLYR